MISIHAPAKGATPEPMRIFPTPDHFNPRSREGSDVLYAYIGLKSRDFNPRSREGSDKNTNENGMECSISIHAPAKGATIANTVKSLEENISIHAPAKGATSSACSARPTNPYFNPRSREGSDRKYAQFFIMILAYLHNIITYFLIKTI